MLTDTCWNSDGAGIARREARDIFHNNPCRFFGQSAKWKIAAGCAMTNSQIDRLGDRLKENVPDETDLQLLDEYRASFADSYEHIVTTLRNTLA